MGKTLFDKIWDAHVVNNIEGGPSQLYIDRHYCHEVTSPQAFEGLRRRGLKVFRPEKTFCSPDHNIPTLNQDKPIADPVSRNQVETLTRNANEFGVTLYGLGHPKNGIIHVIGPENGLTPPATLLSAATATPRHTERSAPWPSASVPARLRWYSHRSASSSPSPRQCASMSTAPSAPE